MDWWCWCLWGVVEGAGGVIAELQPVHLLTCLFCPSSRRVHQQSVQPASPWTAASAVKERHLAVAAALWTHFYPFVRSVRLSQTPPAPLADAAAGQQNQNWGRKTRGQRLVYLR